MTMQELIEWRNQEESLLRGEHPDGMSDLQDSESSESEAAPASAGNTAEQRAAPPERADPPTRKAKPMQPASSGATRLPTCLQQNLNSGDGLKIGSWGCRDVSPVASHRQVHSKEGGNLLGVKHLV